MASTSWYDRHLLPYLLDVPRLPRGAGFSASADAACISRRRTPACNFGGEAPSA